MIDVPGYEDISPPDDAVRHEAIPKPEPETDPVDIFEATQLIDTSGAPQGEKDRVILFSGGDDSLALTHYCFENDLADYVLHLATNSSIPENIDYVRNTCERHGWPFAIVKSPMPLDLFSFRYGFPGSSCHGMAYRYFKSRQLAHFWRHRNGDVKFLSGVRKMESDRRLENIDAEVQYEDASDGGDFDGWWISPLHEKSDSWIADYRKEHDLCRNPVSSKIHRSGDCQCMAFGHRESELVMIQAEYPQFAEWILNVETRCQEYRGRVQILEAEHPDVADEVQRIRKQTRPHPMRLTVLKDEFPTVYDDVVSVSTRDAVLRGQTEETNYIGHGGLSSKELREKTAKADQSQGTLCETCEVPAESLSAEVQRSKEKAKEAVKSESMDSSTSQTKLF